MEVHRFEKIWTAAALLLIVGFISTIVYGAVGPGVTMVEDDGGTTDQADVSAALADELDWSQVENFEAPTPKAQHVSGDKYEAYVVTKQFAFQPGTGQPLRVPAGSTVTLYVTSPDVLHGFEMVGTNVNLIIMPGQISEITVEFDEPGTYSMVCSEYCGAAHHVMEGRVEVVPQSQFDSTEG